MDVKEDPSTDPAELPLRRFLTYRLNRLQARLNAQASRYLAEHGGITLSEWRAIALVGNFGQTTLTEISRESQIDKGLLSRTLKTLIERGLVEGRQDDHDNRVQRLRLTAEGAGLHSRMLPRMRARQRFLQGTLTSAEFEALLSAIDKLDAAAEVTEFKL